MARAGFLALLILLLSACWTGADSVSRRPGPPLEANRVEFSGKVVFVPLEGGFYGLVSEKGRRYDPGRSLPTRFRKDGLQVRVRGLLPGVSASTHMWGQTIRIIEIELRSMRERRQN